MNTHLSNKVDSTPSESNACKPRVLVVENDIATRHLHESNLERWGYQPVLAIGLGKVLLEDAVNKAKKHACHIAMVDMHLLDDYDHEDHSGLDLVPQLKPAISIIVSGSGNDRATVLEALKKEASNFVGKEEPLDRLKAALSEAAKASFACNNGARIRIHEQLVKATSNILAPNKPSQIHELLRSLFPTAGIITVEALDGSARIPTHALRQRSIIFVVSVDGKRSAFVKLERVDKIKREVERFERFVNGKLFLYPRILASNTLWDIGGIVYDFLGGIEDEFTLFSDFYTHNDTQKIIEAVEYLFGSKSWGTIYDSTRRDLGTTHDSLFSAYSAVWGKEWETRLNNQAQRRIFIPSLNKIELQNPLQWIIERAKPEQAGNGASANCIPTLHEAVTHGDLLGDNFFVDRQQKTWTIDYERTGYGPIFQDFVQLETDILVRLAEYGSSNSDEFICLALLIIQPSLIPPTPPDYLTSDNSRKAYKVIAKLRSLAAKYISIDRDWRAYYWGVLLNTAFRTTLLLERELLEPNIDPINHNQEVANSYLFGSLISELLDNWGKQWPSAKWQNITHNFITNQSKPSIQQSNSAQLQPRQYFDNGYALLIGVGDAVFVPEWSLPVTINDVNALGELLRDAQRCAYPDHQVRVLKNKSASLDQIEEGFQWLANLVENDPNSTVFVYFSGHGFEDTSARRYCLIPSDVKIDTQGIILASTVLWENRFNELLQKIKAKRLLVLIDSCHAEGMTEKLAGKIPSAPFHKTPPPQKLLERLGDGEGKAIISSCRSNQKSYIKKDGSLSIFTFHLLEALQGRKNFPNDQDVRVSNIEDHLGRQVPLSVKKDYPSLTGTQNPFIIKAAEDFPVALTVMVKG